MSYHGSAWATLAAFAVMMVISYFLGRKHHPLPYDLKAIGKYVLLAAVLFAIINIGYSNIVDIVFSHCNVLHVITRCYFIFIQFTTWC